MDTRIVWLRRDLRLDDSPALVAAAAEADSRTRVLPLFVLEPRLLDGPTMSPARLAYLCDALADLDRSLRDRGARLVVRTGDARRVVPALAAEVRATRLHFCADVTPLAAQRDAAVHAACAAQGVTVREHPGVMIREPGSVVAANGEMFRVFTPFRRSWEQVPLDPPIAAPGDLAMHGPVRSDALPTVATLGIGADVPDGVLRGGETLARERLASFLADGAADYAVQRDMLDVAGTSRLSADLKYGCLSPRAAYLRLDRRSPGQRAFASELVWRDFYGHVMARWPQVRGAEFNPAYRDLPWRGESTLVKAWRDGRTGYPIVDAAMRQLRREGWMHNRGRMIVASFLCKHLLTDWRIGQAHFLSHLIDGDVASNNGGWQWAAGTGSDAQPYFRIFNPVLQGEKFDPCGRYVRRYVRELAAVPDRWIHHPWDMPDEVARTAGVQLGRDYPEPVVDHRAARSEALEFFRRHRR